MAQRNHFADSTLEVEWLDHAWPFVVNYSARNGGEGWEGVKVRGLGNTEFNKLNVSISYLLRKMWH